MPKRGRLAGRKRQLRWLKRELLGHRVFDPAIFCEPLRSDSEAPAYVPRSPDVITLENSEPPKPSVGKRLPREIQQLPVPVTVAPTRLPTRPLKVSAQIKKQRPDSTTAPSAAGPKFKIWAVAPLKLKIRREGNAYMIGG